MSVCIVRKIYWVEADGRIWYRFGSLCRRKRAEDSPIRSVTSPAAMFSRFGKFWGHVRHACGVNLCVHDSTLQLVLLLFSRPREVVAGTTMDLGRYGIVIVLQKRVCSFGDFWGTAPGCLARFGALWSSGRTWKSGGRRNSNGERERYHQVTLG